MGRQDWESETLIPTIGGHFDGATPALVSNGDAHSGFRDEHGIVPIAFAQNQLGEVRVGAVTNTINTNSNASGRNTPMVQVSMQVRRLTPKECERLQGFPDDYTLVPHRNKPAADGPRRYKALGNSMAVPCMAWIGRRIAAVDAIQSSQSKAA